MEKTYLKATSARDLIVKAGEVLFNRNHFVVFVTEANDVRIYFKESIGVDRISSFLKLIGVFIQDVEITTEIVSNDHMWWKEGMSKVIKIINHGL